MSELHDSGITSWLSRQEIKNGHWHGLERHFRQVQQILASWQMSLDELRYIVGPINLTNIQILRILIRLARNHPNKGKDRFASIYHLYASRATRPALNEKDLHRIEHSMDKQTKALAAESLRSSGKAGRVLRPAQGKIMTVRLVHVNKALWTSRNFMMIYIFGKVRGSVHVQKTIERTRSYSGTCDTRHIMMPTCSYEAERSHVHPRL